VQRVHCAKIYRIKKLIQDINKPVIIAYWFKYDLELLQDAFPQARTIDGTDDQNIIDGWNNGLIPILLLQPRSAGHGIQLQRGGSNLIWYGPVWSRDLVLQTEARIHRQGQTEEVHVYTVACEDTIEIDVIDRVDMKGGYAELLTALLS
jgi:SNF2 family DNA or RNA helicase